MGRESRLGRRRPMEDGAMLRPFGRTSRIRDAVGVLLLVVTGLLYAYEKAHDSVPAACDSCEEIPATPAEGPAAPAPASESLRSAGLDPVGCREWVEGRWG